jgi:hypothetical protein
MLNELNIKEKTMIVLSCMPDAFSKSEAAIEDAIILVSNVVSDVRETSKGILVSRDAEGISVSYQAYKYALGFNVRITNLDQVNRMEAAIDYNINHLQTFVDDYEEIGNQINKCLHYGAQKIQREYDEKVATGELAPETSVKDYFNAVMTPLNKSRKRAKDLIYQGENNLHPNEYLKSLGLNLIRFENIKPLHREQRSA